MARGSRKRSAAKSSNFTTVTEGHNGRRRAIGKDKLQICQLLDSRIADHEKKKGGNEGRVSKSSVHGKQQGSLVNKKLENMLLPVLRKFELTSEREGKVNDNGNDDNDHTRRQSPIVEPVVYTGAVGVSAVTTLDDDFMESSANGKDLSRGQLRKRNKPQLAQLKASVTHPELIEWYDCDANYPYLLAAIKSSKNVVGVPGHWQMKREYLSGRSLLSKRPFELPDIIKKTDIEQMRVTLPGVSEGSTTDGVSVGVDNDREQKSLKEMSRARVRPKLASLDLDYRKLYDIFFKLGAEWKPELLLPFGDLYYENRNMAEEVQWKRIVREKKPGILSREMRMALGLDDGQLPPWCTAMAKIGVPPGYPDLRICGLNWDIKNMKNDVYGNLPSTRSSGGDNKGRRYFGALISFEEADSALEDYIDIPLNVQSQATVGESVKKPEEPDQSLNTNPPTGSVVPITEYVQSFAREDIHVPGNTEEDSEKQLYKVLEDPRIDIQQFHTNTAKMAVKHDHTEHNHELSGDEGPDMKRSKRVPTDKESLEQFKF